jgi:malonyl-CoA/methylmalonyl-CoA synthetase
MPELTASEFRPDGYFVTGDLARIDDAGLVELVGRAKDLIISGGLNVYPIEVETVIDRIPGIRESAVIGLPHGDLGEAVAAVLALEPNFGKFDTRTVFAILKSELAGFKLPKALFVQDVLPRNAMGKIEKAALRTRYAASFAEEVK